MTRRRFREIFNYNMTSQVKKKKHVELARMKPHMWSLYLAYHAYQALSVTDFGFLTLASVS